MKRAAADKEFAKQKQLLIEAEKAALGQSIVSQHVSASVRPDLFDFSINILLFIRLISYRIQKEYYHLPFYIYNSFEDS